LGCDGGAIDCADDAPQAASIVNDNATTSFARSSSIYCPLLGLAPDIWKLPGTNRPFRGKYYHLSFWYYDSEPCQR
jgi:hypothetical protein